MRIPFRKPKDEERALSLDEIAQMISFAGNNYALGQGQYQTTLGSGRAEEIDSCYVGFAQQALCRNPTVFACMEVRKALFSEIRLQFRDKASSHKSNRPGPLFGTQALSVIETPWPGASTGDLLAKAIQSVDLSGVFYALRRGEYLYPLRPDWMAVVVDRPQEPDAQILGYHYRSADHSYDDYFLPEEILRWCPTPHPMTRFTGLSWIEPVVSEIMNDRELTAFKLRYWESGASPSMVVNAGEHTPESFKAWVANFREGNEGRENAHSPLILGGKATAQVVGGHMTDLDLSSVSSASELRICAAAGVPPILLSIAKDSLATYSNFAQSCRRFLDLTASPLARSFCAALENVTDVPSGAELWFDVREIPAYQADVADAVAITQGNSTAIRTLVDGGFEPDSVVKAIEADDLSLLRHTGLTTVQVGPQPIPTKAPAPALVNGNGNRN